MKILHVDTQKGFRGGEQQLLWLAEGLMDAGIGITVACKKNEKLYERCREKKIEVLPLSGNQIVDAIKIGSMKDEFDIMHAHAAKAHTICAFAKTLNKKKLVYTRRVDYKPRNNFITKFKYEKTDRVVAISRFVADVLKGSSFIKGFVDIVYSATDIKLRDRVDLNKVLNIRKTLGGNPLIGTTAALNEQKNIPNLIEAAGFLLKKYPEAKFVVAGEGKLKEKLNDMIEEKGMKNSFKLIGFKKDIENYIKSFDIFVLSSDYEGLGSSLLNAMLLEIPIVATDAGGVGEVVINNRTGILTPKQNPAALAKGIMMIIENKKLADNLCREAYKYVAQNFSLERMIRKYLEIYTALLQN